MHELEKEFISKVLTEASPNYADQVKKMTDWHFGRRNQNLNMSDEKLYMNYSICKNKGFTKEADILLNLGLSRGLSWAKQAQVAKQAAQQAAQQAAKVRPAGYIDISDPAFWDEDLARKVYSTDDPNDIIMYSLDRDGSLNDLLCALVWAVIFKKPAHVIGVLKDEAEIPNEELSYAINEVMNSTVLMAKIKAIASVVLGRKVEGLEEDTVKIKDHKWTNKGSEGTHGTFTTKKAADAQRKAMFANGYHEELAEGLSVDYMISKLREWGKNYNFDKFTDAQIYNIYVRELDKAKNAPEKEPEVEVKHHEHCDKCGTELNDAGECPVCDLGDESALEEDIEKHDTLNPKLWNEDNTLKAEVKDKIIQIVEEFTDGLAEDNIKFKIKDVLLVGSNCSYNYTKDSDLDIHILADVNNLDCPDNLYPLLYGAYRSLFNKKFDIDFYGIPVELYVETEDQPSVSNGIYSVKNDKWVKEPVQADIPDIDQEMFDKEFKTWEDRYNKIVKTSNVELTESVDDAKSIIADQIRGEWEAIRNYEKAADDLKNEENCDDIIKILNSIADEEEVHVGELQKAQSLLDDNVLDNISQGEEEADEHISETANDLKEEVSTPEIDEIDSYLKDIYDLRKEGLADGGEYSIGNLIFKEVRNKGYLDNLKELKNQLISKELSLDEKLTESCDFSLGPYDTYAEAVEVLHDLQDEDEPGVHYHIEKDDDGYMIYGYDYSRDVCNYGESLNESRLSDKDILDARQKLSRAINDQVIVDANGNFNVYNVKEADVNNILSKLRNVDGVIDVHSFASGKYDFGRIDIHGTPARYFTISGRVKVQ